MMVSSVHQVAKKNYYIAIICAQAESKNGQYEAELKPAFDLIGSVKEKFISVSEMYEPAPGPVTDNVYVCASMSPTSHFEGETQNVLDLYKQITGEDLDLVNLPEPEEM